METGRIEINLLIVVVYLSGTVALGIWLARGQRSLEDYFVAGRATPWWVVAVSIIASDFSAISYMGGPAWVFQKDLQVAMGIVLFPFIMLLVVYLFVPFLARLRRFTIYEYLEGRFSPSVRTFGSAVFLLMRGGWIATAIYVQGLALSEVLHVPFWLCVCLVGGVTTLYTVFGGMKAVLWTDVMHFSVLTGGTLIMSVAVLTSFHGKITEIWGLAAASGHTRLFSFHFDLTTEVTVWALIAGSVVINLSSYGSDQVIVQRYLAARSRRDMTRAVLLNGVLVVPVNVLLALLGLGFVAYYRTHPALNETLSSADLVVPHFVTHVLSPGLSGLVIASLFAATMGSVSAGFNSLSTATMMDFYYRLSPRRAGSGRQALGSARLCTLAWGVAGVGTALFVSKLGGIVEIMFKINGFFSGPLVGIFLLGVITKRANSFGVLVGAVLGTATTWLTSYAHVSWLWYGPVGCLTTMATGYLLSFARIASTFAEDVGYGEKSEMRN